MSAAPAARPRAGLVEYLNSRPIGYGLTSGRQRERFEVVQGVPSALADSLARSEIDLALLPSVEYARGVAAGREIAIFLGVAIASLGPAESVLLMSRLPPALIGSVALDASSRTSAALLRLLLRHRWRPDKEEPELVVLPPDLPSMLSRCDAALLIGDRALFAPREHPALVASLSVLDLGREWTAMTGLPFVFAFWAGSRRSDSAEIGAALRDSLEEGIERIPEIVQEFAPEDVAAQDIARRYLSSSMRYGLGHEEIRGLNAFYRLLAEDGQLAEPPALRFHRTAACANEPR